MLTAGIADMLSTASSPAHARLHEIEGVAFENCRISKGISQARALRQLLPPRAAFVARDWQVRRAEPLRNRHPGRRTRFERNPRCWTCSCRTSAPSATALCRLSVLAGRELEFASLMPLGARKGEIRRLDRKRRRGSKNEKSQRATPIGQQNPRPASPMESPPYY